MKNKNISKLLLALPCVAAISGCSSGMTYSMCSTGNVDTDIQSYKSDKQYRKILIDSTPQFASLICTEFNKNNVECNGFSDVFSPLKTYSQDEIKSALKNQGFDSVLVVSDSSNSVNTWNAGSITNFNAVTTGSTMNGLATTTNITGFSRSSRSQVVIYDVPSFEKSYLANTSTSGSGSACVNDYVYFRSMSEEVVKDLLKTK